MRPPPRGRPPERTIIDVLDSESDGEGCRGPRAALAATPADAGQGSVWRHGRNAHREATAPSAEMSLAEFAGLAAGLWRRAKALGDSIRADEPMMEGTTPECKASGAKDLLTVVPACKASGASKSKPAPWHKAAALQTRAPPLGGGKTKTAHSEEAAASAPDPKKLRRSVDAPQSDAGSGAAGTLPPSTLPAAHREATALLPP